MSETPQTSIFDEETPLPAHIPLNPDLTDAMLVDIAIDKNAQVWVFHNKPLPDILEWIEYDQTDKRLVFVTKGGRLNDFGLTIKPLMHKYLCKAQTADVMLVYDETIHDFIRVPLIINGSLN